MILSSISTMLKSTRKVFSTTAESSSPQMASTVVKTTWSMPAVERTLSTLSTSSSGPTLVPSASPYWHSPIPTTRYMGIWYRIGSPSDTIASPSWGRCGCTWEITWICRRRRGLSLSWEQWRNFMRYSMYNNMYHIIAGKFGGLVVYITTAKLKSAKISYSHIYVWRSHTEPPNLIPASISGYTVYLKCMFCWDRCMDQCVQNIMISIIKKILMHTYSMHTYTFITTMFILIKRKI